MKRRIEIVTALVFRKAPWLTFLLKAVITALILALLVSRLDMSAFSSIVGGLDWPLFVFSLAILAGRNVLGAWRHRTLLRYFGDPPGILALFRYYFIGAFFNMFLPTVVGGDIARAYYLYRDSGGRAETMSSVIVERALGLYAMMLLAVYALIHGYLAGLPAFDSGIVRLIFIAFGSGLIVSLLFFSQRLEHLILAVVPGKATVILKPAMNLVRHVGSYRKAPGLLVQALVLSLVFQFVGIISTYILSRSLGETTPFIYFLLFLPVVWLISMVPVSINGLGIRESAYVVLFSMAGMSKEAALAMGLLWFGQTLIIGIAGAFFFLLGGHDYAGIVGFGKNGGVALGNTAVPENEPA